MDHYGALLDEFGARRVVDIGCGTGVFACELARRGLTMIAADPALASLDVARVKAGADLVTWVLGDATALLPVSFDAVTMTGNVAHVFVDDDDWAATLTSARADALGACGFDVIDVRGNGGEANMAGASCTPAWFEVP